MTDEGICPSVRQLASGIDQGVLHKWAIGMLETCQRRRLFVTSQGKVGLAPLATLETDELIFVPGCSHALVIRKHGEDGHIIIGPSYLEELDIESWFGPNSTIPMEEFRFY